MLTVDVALNRDEPEAARAVSPDLDEGWSENVNRIPIPQVHLDDLPTTDCPWCHSPNVALASRMLEGVADGGRGRGGRVTKTRRGRMLLEQVRRAIAVACQQIVNTC